MMWKEAKQDVGQITISYLNIGQLTIMSHQALLDVADIRKEIANCSDLEEWEEDKTRGTTWLCEGYRNVTEVIVTRARLEGEM